MITKKKKQDWATPWVIFNSLHADYGFSVDACAGRRNAKLPRYWSVIHDGLKQPWRGERVFCNPPFGAIADWLTRGYEARDTAFSLFLVPANVETEWFHSLAVHADKHVFVRRVSYDPPPDLAPSEVSSPSFASMCVMYGPGIVPSGLGFSAKRCGKTGVLLK